MMEAAGPGPTTHHSSEAELFKALFLFGSHIPTAGIDTMATLRGKSGLENNGIQQSEPLSQQMGHRSSSVKALPIPFTNTLICQGGENVSPNPLVKGPNHSEPELTNIGRSSSILSSKTTHKSKKTTTLVTKLRNEQQLNTKSSSTSKVPEGVEPALEVYYKILQDIPKSGRQSVRALKKMQANYWHLFSYPQGKVGSLPEVEVGRKVKWRVELKILGLHRQIERGIDCKEVSGNRKDGHKELIALSVVSSNKYEDDLDKGETLIFTGEGGRDKKTKRQTEDQVLGGGNEALYNSYFRQNPIRVIRHRYDAQVMKKWYIYDGLYKVKDKKKVIGISGKEVWQFKLVREPNQEPLDWSPQVGKARKGQGKQANVIVGREFHEKLRKEVHGNLKGSSGNVEGGQILPKRNEEETSMSENDEDDNLIDSEEEEEVGSSDFEGEEEDHLSSSKEEVEEDFALGRTKRPRDLSKGKVSLRAEEDAKPMDLEEKYTTMVKQFKHHDMGGKVIFEGGLYQFSNLAKKNRGNVFDKQHGNGDAYQEERSYVMGEILLVPKHKENLNCTKQEGNHDVSRRHQANLPMQMVSEDEDRDTKDGYDSITEESEDIDIEDGYDSITEESEDKEFEVETIINHRMWIIDGCKQLEYLVCWKGYDEDENSWEPAENMENAPIIVRNYRKQVGLE